MTCQTGPDFLDLEGEDEPLRQVEQEEEDGDLTSGLRINHVRRQSLKKAEVNFKAGYKEINNDR